LGVGTDTVEIGDGRFWLVERNLVVLVALNELADAEVLVWVRTVVGLNEVELTISGDVDWIRVF
jgi:hypothetical protein